MSDKKVLLITGATGQQGGAVIDSLLASPEKSQLTILGMTRDPNSSSAKKLESKSPLIKVIQGSYDDLPSLFSRAREMTSQPVWGVFSVQALGKGMGEEEQGKRLVDESIKQGVKHFVQTSVERGGDEKSWTNPTNIPHFITKHNIELHLRDSTEKMPGEKMSWTILRPVAFMDNIGPGFGTKVFLASWRDTLQQKPLQLIATADIGYFGAQALLHPDAYKNLALGLAGDELSYQQLDETFNKVLGHGAGATYGFLGSALKWGVKEMGTMIDWFKTDGYGVDITGLRKRNPELLDFATWLETKSGFAKGK